MNATAGKIIIDGNAAAAIGCMMAGVQFLAWYPITPSSSLAESLIDYAGKYRLDPETGKPTFAIVQAEDELAAARHGARRRLGGRARDDDDVRARASRSCRSSSGSATTPRSRRSSSTSSASAPRRACRPARCRATSSRRTTSSHGDAQPHPAPPGLGRGVLLAGDGRLRPRRALPDAGLPDDRPRPRDEQLDGRSRSPIPDKPLDRGKVLRTKEELEAHIAQVQGVRALPRRGRRRHPVPHAARASSTTPAAAYFTRGSGHTDRAHVHGAARRLQEQHGPARAQVRDGADATCPSPSSPTARARASASSPTAPRTSPSRRPACILAPQGHRRPTTCACAPCPFTPEVGRLHRRARPRLRRRPEPRRPDVRPAPTRARRRRGRLRSIRHYDGFPLDAETVIEGIEAGEKN